jgi:hypothetical protein
MCTVDDFTVAIGDRYGSIVILRLPDDVVAGTLWRTSQPPERGVFMPSAGQLVRIASFSAGAPVTGLGREGKVLYYATLAGQIGALVDVGVEEEYSWLAGAEVAVRKGYGDFCGFNVKKRFEKGKIGVVDGDVIEMVEFIGNEAMVEVAEAMKMGRMQLMAMLARLKTGIRF